MLNYNLEAPKKDILKILCITNVKFNHLLKIFSIDTETTQFNKKQLDAFIQYLNFTKEFTINTDYDDSIFSKYPKRKPFTLEEIINFKKKITTPKRVAATINKKELKTEITKAIDKYYNLPPKPYGKIETFIKNKIFPDSYMKRSFPNLRFIDVNGNEVYIKDIL